MEEANPMSDDLPQSSDIITAVQSETDDDSFDLSMYEEESFDGLGVMRRKVKCE